MSHRLRMNSISLTISSILVLFLALPQVTNAQTILEEVIVTAQKREQSLQDVAISIKAFSGDMIDDFGFEDTRDIFYQTPNVNISQFSFSGGITIRDNATLNNSLAGADYDWREDSIGLGGDAIDYAEDRILVNLRAFWTSPSERYEVQAHVENVFDKEYIDNMNALAGSDSAYGNMGMPRWAGIKVGVNF